MRTTNTKNYIKFALPTCIAVLFELVLLKQWFCYPCILHPWCIKIVKDTEKLMACVLKDTTIDGSKKCFQRMPCLRDMKYVLKALATSKQKSNFVHSYYFWTNRQKYFHTIFLLKAATLILSLPYKESTWLNQDGGQWLVIWQSFLLTDCAKR